jgi:hypothetical protein
MSYTQANKSILVYDVVHDVRSTCGRCQQQPNRAVAMTDQNPETPRTAMVSVRLSREEEEQLRAEAAKHGQSLSQFIRDVLRSRGGDDSGVADVTLYPTTATVVGGGLALEADDGVLAPRTSRPHVITSYTG